jgi:hypothetical protein
MPFVDPLRHLLKRDKEASHTLLEAEITGGAGVWRP